MPDVNRRLRLLALLFHVQLFSGRVGRMASAGSTLTNVADCQYGVQSPGFAAMFPVRQVLSTQVMVQASSGMSLTFCMTR